MARSGKAAQEKEPPAEQAASFIGFFILLLVFKTFFIPLFVIPTGSMAETLAGAHATHGCPNCGWEYQVGWFPKGGPAVYQLECPNCRFRELYTTTVAERIKPTIGDRITVLGWPYDLGIQPFGPRRWDVVVFRNPQDPNENFIKRLIGLSGEQVQIIDGNVFIDDQIARKPPHVQQSLWFPVFDQDYPPATATQTEDGAYLPRFAAQSAGATWDGLDTRVLRFAGPDAQRGELLFASDPARDDWPARIEDIYGYNAPVVRVGTGELRATRHPDEVREVRLSAEVRWHGGAGYVELQTTKYDDTFTARLHGDGRLVLERRIHSENGATQLAETHVNLDQPLHLALANADYCAWIEVNGERVLDSGAAYGVTVSAALQRAASQNALRNAPGSRGVRIAAERADVALRHVRIERDIYYKHVMIDRHEPGRATIKPFQLREDEFFVLGDNSGNSADSRLWQTAGLHMQSRDYRLGTVPRDQLMGRAFFVYWPGFLPGIEYQDYPLVPDIGRLRWIY